MKKVFISCPFKYRTDENIIKTIEKMHQMAEIIFDQKLEPVHNFFTEGDENEIIPPEGINKSIYFLSKAIEKMAGVDYFIGIKDPMNYSGCYIENEIARRYGIPRTYVDHYILMPDVFEDEFLRW